jgi:hypothetical protein
MPAIDDNCRSQCHSFFLHRFIRAEHGFQHCQIEVLGHNAKLGIYGTSISAFIVFLKVVEEK